MIHTGRDGLTDIDMVGTIDSRDIAALERAGFIRDGRHWVTGSDNQEIAIEVPGDSLFGVEQPALIDVAGVEVQVITVNDLMIDRLIQATDGTTVTWEEALSLAVGAQDRIDWHLIESRCDDAATDDLFLRRLPSLFDRLIVALA